MIMKKKTQKPKDGKAAWTKYFRDFSALGQKETLQLIVLFVGILMIIVGLPLHNIGVIGVSNPYLYGLSAVFWLGSIVYMGINLCRDISPYKALLWFGIAAQTMQSLRIIYLTVFQPEGYGMAIIVNQVVAFTIIGYQAVAFIRIGAIVNTAINMLPLLFALFYYTPSVPSQLVVLFAIVEVGTCLLALFSHRFVTFLQADNADYHKTQDGLLHAFNMSRNELMAYLQLSRSRKPDDNDISRFFELLDEQSEVNLIKAVERRQAERLADTRQFAKHCPQLTATEQEVCRLVVAGKSLSEIARIMDKNANNVSSVRIHIRRKLGLKPGDDLRECLANMD